MRGFKCMCVCGGLVWWMTEAGFRFQRLPFLAGFAVAPVTTETMYDL